MKTGDLITLRDGADLFSVPYSVDSSRDSLIFTLEKDTPAIFIAHCEDKSQKMVDEYIVMVNGRVGWVTTRAVG